MKLQVPGIVYDEFIWGSQVPTEEGWPDPERRAVGKGWQYVYDVRPSQARQILDHVDEMAESSTFWKPDHVRGRTAGRAARRWLDRTRQELL